MPEQVHDRQKLIRKVQQLLRLAEDQRDKPEGATAQRMADAIMAKYEITLAQVKAAPPADRRPHTAEPVSQPNEVIDWLEKILRDSMREASTSRGPRQPVPDENWPPAVEDWPRHVFEEFLNSDFDDPQDLMNWMKTPINRLQRDAAIFVTVKATKAVQDILQDMMGDLYEWGSEDQEDDK